MTQNKMTIEIWSDIVCPFCYIGKVQFEKALKEFIHQANIEVIYKSFQLAPETITNLETTVYEDLAKKKGASVEQIKTMTQNVVQMAQQEGLTFNFDTAKVVNTQKAHEILHLAKKYGKVAELKNYLFDAYFTQSLNIDDIHVLSALATKVGISSEISMEALTTGIYKNEVLADMQEAQKLGITGVPFFVYMQKYALSGAQGYPNFKAALEQIYAEWASENNTITSINVNEGSTCSIDNPNC
ncbi:MAG TPA: DsbA family oxidoreductase [Bacteroidia bacterium]